MSWCCLKGTSASRCLLRIVLFYFAGSKVKAQSGIFKPTQTLPPFSDTLIPSMLSTAIPTLAPTYSFSTMAPLIVSDVSKSQTNTPSIAPNIPEPTDAPTFTTESMITEDFRQSYFGGNDLNTMTPEQITGYQVMMKLNTKAYGFYGGEPIVKTDCLVLEQISFDLIRVRRRNRGLRRSSNDRWFVGKYLWPWIFSGKAKTPRSNTMSRKLEEKELRVSFRMTWSSVQQSLTNLDYVYAFQRYINSEAGVNDTLKHMTNLGIPVTSVEPVTILTLPIAPTNAPSPAPSSVSTTFYPTLLAFMTTFVLLR